MRRREHDGEGRAKCKEDADNETSLVDNHGGELPLVLYVVLLLLPSELSCNLADLLQDAHNVEAHVHAARRMAFLHLPNKSQEGNMR